MKALAITDKVLGVLQLVPQPQVAVAATLIAMIVDEVHAAHVQAAANGSAPPTVADTEAQIQVAAQQAIAIWTRIKAAATAPPSHMDVGNDVPNGGAA